MMRKVLEDFYEVVEEAARTGKVLTTITVGEKYEELFDREVWPEVLKHPVFIPETARTWRGAIIQVTTDPEAIFQIVATKPVRDHPPGFWEDAHVR